MTSRDRGIAEIAVTVQAYATQLGNAIFDVEDVQELIHTKGIQNIPSGLQKIVYSLLALLDCDDEPRLTE